MNSRFIHIGIQIPINDPFIENNYFTGRIYSLCLNARKQAFFTSYVSINCTKKCRNTFGNVTFFNLKITIPRIIWSTNEKLRDYDFFRSYFLYIHCKKWVITFTNHQFKFIFYPQIWKHFTLSSETKRRNSNQRYL